MLLKIVIFILILLVSIAIGYEYSQSYKGKLMVSKDYMALLEYLIDQITFLKKDIPKSISTFEQNRHPCWLKIASLSDEIRVNGPINGWNSWKAQIGDFYTLQPSQLEAIEYTSTYIGQLSSEKQLAHLKNNINMLRQTIQDLDSSINTKCTTFQKVSVFIGIIVGLLII